MENKELETWLEETKAKNLSDNKLWDEVGKLPIYISELLKGNTITEKASILFNQWQQETEFSPKRGDRVLVWNDGKSFEFERIFLTKIEGTEEPIYVVAKQSETSFIGGGMFYIETYEHMKPLPTATSTETDFKSKVIELIEERIKKSHEIMERHVKDEQFNVASAWQNYKTESNEILKAIKQLC